MSSNKAPVMLSQSKYDEDITGDLITQIFNLHVDLGYIPSECIVFPAFTSEQVQRPPILTQNAAARHSFSPEVHSCFQKLGLNKAIPALLERIPFLHSSVDNRDYPFYMWDAGLISYDNVGSLEYSRDPRGVNFLLDQDDPRGLLDGDEIALTTLMSRDGFMLILNVVENTIRIYSNYYNEPDIPEDPNDPRRQNFPFPDIPSHHKNFEAFDAPIFLQDWIDRLRTLRSIPWKSGTSARLFDADILEKTAAYAEPWGNEPEFIAYKALKRTLQEDYGWPDHFKKERWLSDRQEICNKIGEELDRAMEQDENEAREANEALHARLAASQGHGWSEVSVLGAILLWTVWCIYVAI